MAYAVFREGERLSKWYPFKLQAIVDATEKGFLRVSYRHRWLDCDIVNSKEVL
jgi:hypothetical protein